MDFEGNVSSTGGNYDIRNKYDCRKEIISMAKLSLQNPLVYAAVLVAVWVGVRMALGTLVFGESPFHGIFVSLIGGLAFASVIVYFRHGGWKSPKNDL